MGSTLEIVLVIIGMSFWFLFPIGMFLSVSSVDKNTDQIIRLEKLRHESTPIKTKDKNNFRPVHFNWHHPVIYFKQWLQH